MDPSCSKALRSIGVTDQEYSAYEQWQLDKVYQQADNFDVIHIHMGHAALPYANFISTSIVHTLHGIFTAPIEQLFVQNRHQNYVSISDAQRRPELGLNYVATVYNGIDTSLFEFRAQPNHPSYLAFLGRFSPEKGPHLAIEIAKQAGWPLKMAGKVDPVDQVFFEQTVKPLLDGQQIEYLGEVDHAQKCDLMAGAMATLFPITWREPFGLVMAESMACGAPVIAMALGAAPEVIIHGETGFLCRTIDECVAAIAHIPTLDRQSCRAHVEENFSVQRMVNDYEAVYRQILAKHCAQADKWRSSAPYPANAQSYLH
ncbi:MAG: glycosyltransferase family 4 protein [Leptolyngbyaceae cyanobacterium MO_188.B28]|nr:glycosyltransferase family 4 protein [Leptolyngbyaceae cyanobacterium MO_188.B28]